MCTVCARSLEITLEAKPGVVELVCASQNDTARDPNPARVELLIAWLLEHVEVLEEHDKVNLITATNCAIPCGICARCVYDVWLARLW